MVIVYFPPEPTKSIYVPTSSPAPVVPTPLATTCPTPGVYTIPATTITLTESTTVCAATSTHVPSGTHTYGGVTTVVTTATTVVCPYATVSTHEGVVTSTILTTTYVCPSAGTYTIAPETTTVSLSTVLVYPTPASYPPGTYTQPEIVTTITETNYVVFCPYTSPAPEPTSTYVAPPPAKTEVPKKVVASVEAPKKSSAPASGGKLGVTGNQWGITYTPYTEDAAGTCKDKETIKSDIGLIASKGFTAIRVYSTDCYALELIPTYCQAHGIKMILGVFIDESGISGAQEQIDAIVAWKQWALVDLIVIGNEALHAYPPRCSPSELAGFISSCKSALRAANYNGYVTTAEPLNVWQENAGVLCGVCDVVGLNVHPFFNADVDAANAGKFAKGQLEIAGELCPGKDAYNLETGWPNAASRCNGIACAGPSEQATAIKGIMEEIGGRSIMFSFGDDKWKQPGDFGCEQHWGAIQLFGN
jgi:exo-beta-1,3-glucanase (GH17 family)